MEQAAFDQRSQMVEIVRAHHLHVHTGEDGFASGIGAIRRIAVGDHFVDGDVGPWRSLARIGERPRTKRTGRFQAGGGDEFKPRRNANERTVATHFRRPRGRDARRQPNHGNPMKTTVSRIPAASRMAFGLILNEIWKSKMEISIYDICVSRLHLDLRLSGCT